MSNTIDSNKICELYNVSKDVFEDIMEMKNALTYLSEVHDVNQNSARDYISNFQKMINGLVYERTMNKEATEYFIKKIDEDYGGQGLKNALTALELHLLYYEKLGRNSQPALWTIHGRYSSQANMSFGIFRPRQQITISQLENNILIEDRKVEAYRNSYISNWNISTESAMIERFVDACLNRGFKYALQFNHPREDRRAIDAEGKENGDLVPYISFGRKYGNGQVSWDAAIDQFSHAANGTLVIEGRHKNTLYQAQIPFTKGGGGNWRITHEYLESALDAIEFDAIVRNPPTQPPIGNEKPTYNNSTIKTYVRDPNVKGWVLARAKGVCECCDKEAPFKNSRGLSLPRSASFNSAC